MHYVCSDIHGQIGLYEKMMEVIDLQPEDKLYVLGDVIDRGPDSMGILRDMMGRDNVEMFIGNHEMMMLDYLRNVGCPENWFYGNNGGRVTYEAFIRLDPVEQAAVLDYLDQAWIQKYIEVEGIRYGLHHSYFLPRKKGKDVRMIEEEDRNAISEAVWRSPYRYFEYAAPAEYDDGRIHLIGHVPVQNFRCEHPPLYNEELGDRLINIDGGCAMIAFGYSGGLFCMSLEKNSEGKREKYWICPD